MSLAKIITLTFLITSAFIITACQAEEISQTQLQLVRYSLKITDLPDGWKFSGKDWGVDYGGESYSIIYERDTHVFAAHTVAIYSGAMQSQQAYEDWEDEWFDSAVLQLDVSFSPLDQEDDHRFECSQVYQGDPLIFCVYLQRHDEMISFVRISSDNRNKNSLTFKDINDILGILDTRLNEVVLDE